MDIRIYVYGIYLPNINFVKHVLEKDEPSFIDIGMDKGMVEKPIYLKV